MVTTPGIFSKEHDAAEIIGWKGCTPALTQKLINTCQPEILLEEIAAQQLYDAWQANHQLGISDEAFMFEA